MGVSDDLTKTKLAELLRARSVKNYRLLLLSIPRMLPMGIDVQFDTNRDARRLAGVLGNGNMEQRQIRRRTIPERIDLAIFLPEDEVFEHEIALQ